MRSRGAGAVAIWTLVMIGSLRAGESSLTVADLAAYRAALTEKGVSQQPPAVVGFRELWDHPERYQGRRVQVQGRQVRRFRQGPFGAFPPLEETWLFSPAGNPFCLVFPAPASKDIPTARTKPQAAPQPSPAQVQFTGTFLKLVEYQGADGARLAPLIVGPAPPSTLSPVPSSSAQAKGQGPWASQFETALAVVAAVFVALVLAWQYLRRPLSPSAKIAPAPLFDDAPTASPPR